MLLFVEASILRQAFLHVSCRFVVQSTWPPYTQTRYLCDEIARRYKEESSLAKAGLWATLLTDVLVTAREKSYGSISEPWLDRLCALAARLDVAVKEDVFGDAAVRDVQR